jgi:hypothetical protein
MKVLIIGQASAKNTRRELEVTHAVRAPDLQQ